MSKRKNLVKHQCSLYQYLLKKKDSDIDFVGLFDDLCAKFLLNPRRGTPGLTFLYPDKRGRDTIKSASMGGNEEEALMMLKALAIADYLPNPVNFMEKKDNIPNALNQKIEVKSADNKKVVLANGAELVPDPEFRLRADYPKRLMVYIISKDLVPIDGPPAEPIRIRVRRGVTGGREAMENREVMARKVQQEYLKQLEEYGYVKKNPMLETVLSFCYWCRWRHRDDFLEYIVPILDWCPEISFYLLFEPFSTGDKVVADSRFDEWQSETMGYYFSSNLSNVAADYIASVNKFIREYRDSREEKEEEVRPALIQDIVNKFALSDALLGYYHGNYKKASQDELRYLLYMMIRDINDNESVSRTHKPKYFRDFIYKIEYIYKPSSDLRELKCLNKNFQVNSAITDNTLWISTALMFAKTDAFNYRIASKESLTRKKSGDYWATSMDSEVSISTVNKGILLSYIKLTDLEKKTYVPYNPGNIINNIISMSTEEGKQ
jgi:hypothetical protein